MRKLLLGVVLILLIIGVSYLKTVREEDQRADVARQLSQEADAESADLKQSVDSLQAEVDRNQRMLDDTLQAAENQYGEEIDSLHAALAGRDADLDSLRKLTTKPKAAVTKNAAAKEDRHKTLEFHRKVLTYYKKRHDDLPRDLTPYEQRVALSEIRTETATRFAISVARLNEIRKKNNLDF